MHLLIAWISSWFDGAWVPSRDSMDIYYRHREKMRAMKYQREREREQHQREMQDSWLGRPQHGEREQQ